MTGTQLLGLQGAGEIPCPLKALPYRLGLMPQATGAWSGIRPLELLRYLAGLYAHPHDVDALAEARAEKG